MPIIPALAVVWASEPRVLKLIKPFSEAVFTTTPWLAFRCGHAAQDYKTGARKHPTMRGIAATLSDQDMADLAAYYADQTRK
jgi:hypothetical protein